MEENILPTVIKVPLELIGNGTTANRRIRLRNNIRLNLPPDQLSLLHCRPLCLLLLLYLAYTMYLHYVIYSHVVTQDVTIRRCTDNIARLQKLTRDSERAHDLNINDLKQSLQSFIHTLKSLKSSPDQNLCENVEALESSYESSFIEDYESSSNQDHESVLDQDYDSSLDQDYGSSLKESTTLKSRMERGSTKIPEDHFGNRTEFVITWENSADIRKNNDSLPSMIETSFKISLVLPHLKMEESKSRRERDLTSSQTNQAKVSILLKGAAPMASIRDGGVIRPWYLDARANGNKGDFDVSSHFVLQELNGKVQILKSGLYIVYAQIYYTTSEPITNSSDAINSYSVTIASSPIAERHIAVCSVHASVNFTSEVSCHLSIVYHLSAGEKVYLVQREPNRSILLKEGYSYFGLSTLRVDD